MSSVGSPIESVEDLNRAVTIPVEAYISESYARAERDKLWRKVWQQVGRVEEISEVGDYLTYNILDDSIIVVRASAGQLMAYHNVCAAAESNSAAVTTGGDSIWRVRTRGSFIRKTGTGR